MFVGFLLESWPAPSWDPAALSWTRVSPNALRGSDLCFLQHPELLGLIICLSTFILAAQTLDCYTTVAELCHFKKPASHCPRYRKSVGFKTSVLREGQLNRGAEAPEFEGWWEKSWSYWLNWRREFGMACFSLTPCFSWHHCRKFTLCFWMASVTYQPDCTILSQHTLTCECATAHSVSFCFCICWVLDVVFLSTLKHGRSLFWKLCRSKW